MKGGGLDCSKLGEENYQPTQNGIWMKIQAFNDWITETIFNELLQGKKLRCSPWAQTSMCSSLNDKLGRIKCRPCHTLNWKPAVDDNFF